MEIVAVQQGQQEARIDTRALAEAMDNQHKNVIDLIRKYQSDFEALGQVAFETEVGRRAQGGGMAQVFTTLNEGQCYFLLTLVRNSERTVPMKRALIEKVMAAFSLIRQQQAQAHAQALADLGRRELVSEIVQTAKEKAREHMASQVVTVAVIAHAYGLKRDTALYNLEQYRLEPLGWFEDRLSKRRDKTEYVYSMLAVYETFRGGMGPLEGKGFIAYDGEYTTPKKREWKGKPLDVRAG